MRKRVRSDLMALHRVVAVYTAPIPVGHRVEIRWFRKTTRGLLGASHDERPSKPVILDLDSGIEWGTDHANPSQDRVKRRHQPLALADTPAGEVTRLLRGVVRSCRVLHSRSFSEHDVQTEVTVDGEVR